MADDKIKILLSSSALQKKLYSLFGYAILGLDVLISVHKGRLFIGFEEMDVESNSEEFTREYPYAKLFQLYKLLQLISDQPIVLELGYSDWITIKDINL